MAATETTETIEAWLKCHRISNIPTILDAINDLGATELRDLLDLGEEDVLKFQPPLMKKLEYVRFTRGVASLQESAAASESSVTKMHVVHQVPSSEITIPEGPFLNYRNDSEYQYDGSYPRPPLPAQCLTKGCTGVLSVHLGSRKSKYLMKIPGTPDSRWTATCSMCSKKWHCCHFLCGKLQKISSLGTSDIIRHEQGRLNRWQGKIQPPCSMNPRFNSVKAGYEEEMTRLQNTNESNGKIPTLGSAVVAESSSGTHDPSSESMSSPIHTDAFDDELKSILGPIDDDAWEVNMLEHDSAALDDDHDHNYDIDISICPKEISELPANKKVKTGEDSSAAINLDYDKEMDELCDKVVRDCILNSKACKMFRQKT
jgi:hypothetical protein